MRLSTFSRTSAVALAALLLASCGDPGPEPVISVEDAWGRSTMPGSTSSAAYFTIQNAGGEDRLLSVTSPAGDASLHVAAMDNGIMRMRPLEALEVPANSSVRLEPGGTHVMLTGLEQALDAGSAIPIDLHFERSGERLVSVEVRSATDHRAAHGAMM